MAETAKTVHAHASGLAVGLIQRVLGLLKARWFSLSVRFTNDDRI
jgi:hypothetical protein